MVIHWADTQRRVRVLLDTGCSVPLINQELCGQVKIALLRHEEEIPLRNFSGEIVAGAGQFYTRPLLLQHRQHYTRETFEVAPLEPGVDLFLPFWWIEKHPPQGAWNSPELRFSSPICLKNCTREAASEFSLVLDESILQNSEARIIGYVSAISANETADPLELVPDEFRQYLGILGKEAADALPEHRSYDCKIDLKDGEVPPWGPIYPLSEVELQTLREWLKEMLRTGKIRRSTSSAGSPILFVPKPNGHGLRLCVDYRGINRITIPNRYPLPLMQELQDRVQGARWFTKMDFKSGFALIRIREGDEWKTAFRTRYGLYEFNVMPFGLTNTPVTFQDMMNHVFSDMIDLGLVIYMDDILVYAKTLEEHDNLVRRVLQRLTENKLAVEPAKCVWRCTEVEFLGYIISRDGIKMSQEKVEAVLNWKYPTSLNEVQSFLGFANFYRRFIRDYSRVARPLTELTKGDAKVWKWTDEGAQAFDELKLRFTTAPILAHFDPQRPVIIETDASDFALGAVLSQRDDENRLHPVAFHSRKFQPAEINYEIHDKELLAIVDAFKHWRRYCEGAVHQVQVFSDHQNLEYFTTTKVLNCRQAHWAQELAGIDFKIYYRPGSQNGKPDALSRRSEYRPEKGGSENQPITTVLHKKHFASAQTGGENPEKDNTIVTAPDRQTISFICSARRLSSLPTRKWMDDFVVLVKKAGEADPVYREAYRVTLGETATQGVLPELPLEQEVADGPREAPLNSREARKKDVLEIKDGLLYRKGMLWIPEDKDLINSVLESEHDTKVAGHMGQDKTIELLRRSFWWPKMDERIIDFVRSCPECQRNKASRHHPYGLLSPLELPYAPWQSIAMDFITDLPLSDGCDQL
jgi:hypothetical protein